MFLDGSMWARTEILEESTRCERFMQVFAAPPKNLTLGLTVTTAQCTVGTQAAFRSERVIISCFFRQANEDLTRAVVSAIVCVIHTLTTREKNCEPGGT